MDEAIKVERPLDDWAGFFEELQKDSPRATVVLGAAFLDEILREILANFLIDELKRIAKLIGGEKEWNRPLSSLSARIEATYCLGLISKEEYEDLNNIRKIRNRFAHRLHDISFEDSKIAGWCTSLLIPQNFGKSPLVKNLRTNQDRFTFTVVALTSQLGVRALDVKQQRRKVHPDITIIFSQE